MPDVDASDSALRFVGELAMTPPLAEIEDARARSALVERFRAVLLEFLPQDAPSAVRAIWERYPAEKLDADLEKFQTRLQDLVGGVLWNALIPSRRARSYPIGIGLEVRIPIPMYYMVVAEGDSFRTELASGERESLPSALFMAVFTNGGRFPFGVCRRKRCGKIFHVARKGRPRRFCSEYCKGRAIPSAANTSEYQRKSRRKRRAAEIERAWKAIEADPMNQLEALRREFPQGSLPRLRSLQRAVWKRNRGVTDT